MATYKLDFKRIREQAKGNWQRIFTQLSPGLKKAMEANSHHVACEMHQGKDGDGFRFFEDWLETGGSTCNTCGNFPTGFDLLIALSNKSVYEIYKEVDSVLNDQSVDTVHSINITKKMKPTTTQPINWNQRLNNIKKVWTAAYPITELNRAILDKYFSHRYIPIKHYPKSIRFEPQAPYYTRHDNNYIIEGYYPAFIALQTDAIGNVVNLQRTYITKEGYKAPVKQPKKFMSKAVLNTSGSLIKLFTADNIVGICEGIENSLAIHYATGLPMYCATTANFLRTAQFEDRIQHCFIFSDLDRTNTGQQASQDLSERLTNEVGISSTIYYPPGPIHADNKGVDWNNVLETHGVDGFPNLLLFKQDWKESLAHTV